MRLSRKDVAFLYKIGEKDEQDILQISRAATKTKYYVSALSNGQPDTKERRISQKEAIAILGRERFLAGLDRSAFHWSATVESEDGTMLVYFDSSAFFREG